MGRLDVIFQKIISDADFASAFNVAPNKYTTVDIGKKSLHPQVRAVAETLELLNKKINDVQSNMRIHNLSGPVIIDEAEFQAIYRKVVSALTK